MDHLSVLYFFTYINDITDHVNCFPRLYADE